MNKVFHRQMPDKPLELILDADGEQFYGLEQSEITSHGRWRDITIALDHYKQFSMTGSEWIEALDLIDRSTEVLRGKDDSERLEHMRRTIRLITNETRTRKDLFYGENFIAYLAALLFFKLDDDIETSPDHDEVLRRIEIFKKKVGPKILSIRSFRAALGSSRLLNIISLTPSTISSEWLLRRSAYRYLIERTEPIMSSSIET